MSYRIRSARALRSPLLGLEGPHRPRIQRRTWPLLLAVLALLVAWLLARRAAPASGAGLRCESDWDCPAALSCSAGRCR